MRWAHRGLGSAGDRVRASIEQLRGGDGSGHAVWADNAGVRLDHFWPRPFDMASAALFGVGGPAHARLHGRCGDGHWNSRWPRGDRRRYGLLYAGAMVPRADAFVG